jgi:hypothetical protein
LFGFGNGIKGSERIVSFFLTRAAATVEILEIPQVIQSAIFQTLEKLKVFSKLFVSRIRNSLISVCSSGF